jgi:hypothetical protein
MDDAELTSHVIKRLAGEDDPNEIILELCQLKNWSWPEAEAFMKAVQEAHEPDIVRRQFPLLTILAFGTFVGGIALIGYSVFAVAETWNALTVLARGSQLSYDPITHLRLILDTSLGPFSGFILGLAMLLGSLLGMRDVWSAILNRSKV